MKSSLSVHWKDWCWSWNSNTLATWCEEPSHWEISWCWERLRAGGEGDGRWWDGYMASPTRWTWVWVNSGSWWWTGRPGMLLFMGSQRVGHDWVTELNWTETLFIYSLFICIYIILYNQIHEKNIGTHLKSLLCCWIFQSLIYWHHCHLQEGDL